MTAKHASPMQALFVDNDFDGEIFIGEPMSKHTSYRIGGPARYFARVDSIGALMELLEACDKEELKRIVVGRGTNLLVSDAGYDGAVITLGRDFRNFETDREAEIIVCGCAAPLASIVQEALRQSLSGMEFAVGTPGSVGGALRMNAGTKDDWIGSRVGSVTVMRPGNGLVKLLGSDVEWGYRTTSFDANDVILECELALKKGDPFFIRGKMEGSLSKRKKTQPMGQPSCGSVFRNPEGYSAAKLIDDAGLKGTTIGGAQVSNKHANFIVNTGDATADDVLVLINLVKSKVKETNGIELTTEVKLIGF